MYVAVLQSVLLFGCETWVITKEIHQVLEGFHNRVARRISRKMPKLQSDGSWTYPPIEEAREIAGLWPIGEYIQRRHNRMVQEISTRPVKTLCDAVAETKSGSPHHKWWWWHPPITAISNPS
jgi:hypothetical protein